MLNGLMAGYTLAKVEYAFAYVGIESEEYSRIGGYLWWTGEYLLFNNDWHGGKEAAVVIEL